jgi:hypothetical protein
MTGRATQRQSLTYTMPAAMSGTPVPGHCRWPPHCRMSGGADASGQPRLPQRHQLRKLRMIVKIVNRHAVLPARAAHSRRTFMQA